MVALQERIYGNFMNVHQLFKYAYLGIGIIALFRTIQQVQVGEFGWAALSLTIFFFCCYRFFITGRPRG